ncbi:MAG TPA: hypothetical protein VM822_17790 [Pseudolabrys sp.]|nr:hypothetical protein [Pseudolabrys sp.]
MDEFGSVRTLVRALAQFHGRGRYFAVSIATSNSARVAYGWRVFEAMLGGVYLGPVIEIFSGRRHIGTFVLTLT